MLPVRIAAFCLLFAAASAHGVKTDSPAPKFSLKNSSGQTRTLADGKGRVTLINFWASWCQPCLAELPHLNQLAIEQKGKVRVVAINADNSRSKAAALLDTLRLEFSPMEILWDPQSRVIAAYDPPKMPSSYILDSAGVVRSIHAGFHAGDEKAWRREIDGLLRGRKLRN